MRLVKLLVVVLVLFGVFAAAAFWHVTRVPSIDPFGDAEDVPVTPFAVTDVLAESYYNVDHAALGTGTSLIYGDSQGRCGFVDAVAIDKHMPPRWEGPSEGVVLGLSDPGGVQLFPFIEKSRVPEAKWIPAAQVRRKVTPCADTIATERLTIEHFSRLPRLAEWDGATLDARRWFVLPATWIRVRASGRPGVRVLIGTGAKGDASQEKGRTFLALAKNFLATDAEDARVVQIGGGSALSIGVPAAGLDAVVVVGKLDTRAFALNSRFASAALFTSREAIADEALRRFSDVREECAAVDALGKLSSPERAWMSATAVASYRANTMLLLGENERPLWVEVEGAYRFVNTLDLTVDHIFLHDKFFPWATRSVLDVFAWRYAGRKGDAIEFEHDMGRDDFDAKSGYGPSMAREELLNWVLCAAVYGRREESHAWLAGKQDVLASCMASMTLPPKPYEITTFDSLPRAIRLPAENPYVAVKTFVAWRALACMYRDLGDTAKKQTCEAQALRARNEAIALLACAEAVPVLPALEPLALLALFDPDALTKDEPLVSALRGYARRNLVKGQWIEPDTLAWQITPESKNTWLSKVYLAQHVVETLLDMRDVPMGDSDRAHATMVWLASWQGWCDQIHPRGGGSVGSLHYPRGVTSVVWWRQEGRGNQ